MMLQYRKAFVMVWTSSRNWLKNWDKKFHLTCSHTNFADNLLYCKVLTSL